MSVFVYVCLLVCLFVSMDMRVSVCCREGGVSVYPPFDSMTLCVCILQTRQWAADASVGSMFE